MSDLQCAARFLVWPGSVDPGRSLVDERVAVVYDAGVDASAVPADFGVARPLERPVTLSSVTAREPDALQMLRDLSDLHRGETVLILVEGAGTPVEVRIDGDGMTVSHWPED